VQSKEAVAQPVSVTLGVCPTPPATSSPYMPYAGAFASRNRPPLAPEANLSPYMPYAQVTASSNRLVAARFPKSSETSEICSAVSASPALAQEFVSRESKEPQDQPVARGSPVHVV